jgi:hypothetical protein
MPLRLATMIRRRERLRHYYTYTTKEKQARERKKEKQARVTSETKAAMQTQELRLAASS